MTRGSRVERESPSQTPAANREIGRLAHVRTQRGAVLIRGKSN